MLRNAADLLFINLAAEVGNAAVVGVMGEVGMGIPERLGDDKSLLPGMNYYSLPTPTTSLVTTLYSLLLMAH